MTAATNITAPMIKNKSNWFESVLLIYAKFGIILLGWEPRLDVSAPAEAQDRVLVLVFS